jgi:paraquat-inducible protein B
VSFERRYPVIPTIPTALEQVRASATQLLNKLGRLPIDQIGEDLRQTVQGLNQLVNSPELQRSLRALNGTLDESRKLMRNVNNDLMPDVSATIKQADRTLEAAEGIIAKDSAINHELRRMLEELSNAARSIRVMADYLERHPDALIYGKGRRQ